MSLSKKARIAALVAAAAIVLAGCAPAAQPDASDGGAEAKPVLKLGYSVSPVSWDPSQSLTNAGASIYQAVYDSIIRRTETMDLVPMLGTSWEYNDDQTELTVKLRTDVTFTDGTSFNADAVKANAENFKNGNGPQANTAGSLDSVEVVSDDTVIYHLTEPDPAFVSYLSGPLGQQGSPELLGTDEMKAAPVGTGPYKLDESRSTVDTIYTLVANEDYWAPELQKFSEIDFSIMTDATARLNALLSGQVDSAAITPATADQAEASGKTVLSYPVDWAGFIIEDRAGQNIPALGDVRVRQAINYAMDRDGYVQIYYDRATATSQIFGETTPAFDEDLDDYYTYDPDKARELMAEAGYADGFDVTLPGFNGLMDPALQAAVTQQLGDIGIRITFKEFATWGDTVAAISSGDYSMPIMNQTQGDMWVEVKKMIAPTGLYNPLGYTDPKVDAMMETMQNDPSKFDETAAELGQYVVEQAWFAPFYRRELVFASSDTVKVVAQPQLATPAIYNYAPAE